MVVSFLLSKRFGFGVAGAVGALERLAAASWSELVAARAKQALGEFHEGDAF